MRISVIKNDPAYHPTAHLYRVLLDGAVREDCHTADEEAGRIWCFDVKTGEQTEVCGKVSIVKPAPHALAIRVCSLITTLLDAIGRDSLVDVDRAYQMHRDEMIAGCAELIDALKPGRVRLDARSYEDYTQGIKRVLDGGPTDGI